jgi:AAA ATPase domain
MKNPFHPGVGTVPPFLAGRDPQIRRFEQLLENFPEKRTNARITGLRGVGKTVLLKQFEQQAKARDWLVIRRDLSPRTNDEREMAAFLAEVLREAVEAFSTSAKLRNLLSNAMTAIGDIQVAVGEDVTVSLKGRRPITTALETRIFKALAKIGELAGRSDRGFALMLDEAHVVADRPKVAQWPFYALVAAFVRAHDQEEPPLPVMLVLSGLPPLIEHLQAARSHSERFFRAEQIANLRLDPDDGQPVSEAALALTTPTEGRSIAFDPATADRLARDVDGYPYFIQYFGEALWEAAENGGYSVIDDRLYDATSLVIQRALDQEFFETRYRDVRQADQMTLRVAASLGSERFKVANINAQLTSRNANANAQSVNRLVNDNVIFRDQQGVYAYTAPLFGDFMRRRHPREESDT